MARNDGRGKPRTALDMLERRQRPNYHDEEEEIGPTASLHPDRYERPRRGFWSASPSIATILLWFFLFPPVGGTLMVVECRPSKIADWEYWAGFVVPFYGMVKFAVCD